MGRKKLSEEEKLARKATKITKNAEKKVEKAVVEGVEKVSEQVTDIAEKIEQEVKEEIKELTGKEKAKKELLEKAKKLGEKLSGEVKSEDIKEKLVESRKTLIPLEDYIKAGIYIGTKVITPHMRQYVYRRRNDGIAILDVNKIDSRLKEFIKMFVKYSPENFILVCKREAGWGAVKKFSELTGVRVFMKKYPAGILTNPVLPNFFETEMVFIIDPWIDKNAMNDAKIMKKKVLALCDTNNYTFGTDFFIPCNNKSAKSIGLILWILAGEYLKHWKIDKKLPSMEEFIGEELGETQG